MKIKIRHINEDSPCLLHATRGNYIDLYVNEDIVIRPFEHKKINLGVAMELPEGYYAEIVPRSSTFGRYGLIMTNSFGVVDSTYNGDNDIWMMPVYKCPIVKSFKDFVAEVILRRPMKISKGTRLCQFRVVKAMEQIEFESVDTLNNEDRGGFGSSGV